MATTGKDTGIVGYNVQAAVDTENDLIVADEVTNVGTDRHQLSNIAEQARTEMGVETLDAVADRATTPAKRFAPARRTGITVTLPKPMTSNSKAEGRFGKQDLRYLAAEDAYVCSAGRRLAFPPRPRTEAWCYVATGPTPVSRAIKHSCTTGKEAADLPTGARNRARDCAGTSRSTSEKMTMRRQTAEHPFGTIKCWMEATHSLTKRLPKVATEMALNGLAYNMKRVTAIIGVAGLLEALAV